MELSKGKLLYNVLLFVVLICLVESRLFIQNPRGENEDTMDNGDDEFHEFSITKPLRIGNTNHTTFKVSFNGGILPRPIISFNSLWQGFPIGTILPYWADAYFKIACEPCIIRIVRNPNTATINLIAEELGIIPDINRTLIVTWHESPSYGSNKLTNTFQCILTGDATGEAYAIFSYKILQYGDRSAKVGVRFENHFVELQGSQRSAQQLVLRSNVNKPGIFVLGLNSISKYYVGPSSSSFGVIVQATCSHVPGEITYNQQCIAQSDPQCGSDGVTYTNKCFFNQEACRLSGTISIVHPGACLASTPHPVTTDSTTSTKQTTTTNKQTTTTNKQTMATTKQTTATTKQTTATTKQITTAKPMTTADPNMIDCRISNGGCQDECVSSVVPNTCKCTIGYLTTDMRTCNYTNTLVIGAKDNMYLLSQGVVKLSREFSSEYVFGLAHDYTKNRVFFSVVKDSIIDFSSQIGYISLISGAITVLFTHPNQVEGLAFDERTDSLYFTDRFGGKGSFGYFTNVYSTGRTVVNITTDLKTPRGIALDYCHSIAFVCDWGTDTISRWNGASQTSQIIASDVQAVNYITLDRDRHKVYFTNAVDFSINEMNYDGSCRRYIAVAYNQNPYGITFLDGNLYWTNWRKNQRTNSYGLWRTNIYTQKSDIVIETFSGLQFDIDAFTPQRAVNCKPLLTNQSICNFIKPKVPDLCFNYGPSSGDTLAPQGDDVEFALLDIKLRATVPLFSTMQSRVYISPNGIISIGAPDNRTTVAIPEPTGSRIYLAGYVTDMLTIHDGKIWYRESNSRYDLDSVAQYIRQKDPAFQPNHIIIVTFEEVLAFDAFTKKQTFQVAIVSDAVTSYGVWCFGKLDQPGGVAGFYESDCNYGTIKATNNELVQEKVVVLKLTNQNCVTTPVPTVTTARPNTTQRPPSPTGSTTATMRTTTKRPPFTSTLQPVDLKPVYYFNKSLTVVINCRTVGIDFMSLHTHSKFKPKNYLFQMVSGTSISFMYHFAHRQNIEDSSIASAYLTMLDGRTTMNMYYQVVAFGENMVNSAEAVVGSVDIPIYSYGGAYCFHVKFPQKISTQNPVIILSTGIRFSSLNQMVSTWIKSTNDSSFDVCLQELYSFSGIKYNLSLHYVAINPHRLIQSNQEDYIPTEANVMIFPSGALPQDRVDIENIRYCQTLVFKHSYHNPPYVFVTPQVGARGLFNGQVHAWVREIQKRFAVICAKNQLDYYYGRIDNIHVHYIIKGEKDACTGYQCPDHLQCHTDKNGRPSCGCIEACPDNTRKPVCGNDYVTYHSKCQFNKETCENYGIEKMRNITMAYEGECSSQPYQSGRVVLDSVPGIPVAFCKYVSLNQAIFHPMLRIHVLLTVETTHNFNSKQKLYDAAASWTEDVTTSGFKVCAMIAGRHYFGGLSAPVVDWVAFQSGITKSAEGSLDSGMVEMPTWYTGSRCVDIDIKHPEYNPKIAVSVEHATARKFSDAMTAWSEKYLALDMMNITNNINKYRVCSRELQNFDGLHQGVRIHWMAFYKPIERHVPGIMEITVPINSVGNENFPIYCVKKYIQNVDPFLPNSTVIVSPASSQMLSSTQTRKYSNKDYVAWIQSNDGANVNICVKSLHSSSTGEEIKVNLQIIPNLCGEGWSYHVEQCLHFSPTSFTYNNAVNYCKSIGGNIASLETEYKAYFGERIIGTKGWLGLTDSSKEGNWVWASGKPLTYKHWQPTEPNGGTNENCAIYMRSGGLHGWLDVSCLQSLPVLCEKDFEPGKPKCEKPCLNNGECAFGNNGPYCKCSNGYVGQQCENRVVISTECTFYTTHNDDYRIYTGSQRTPIQKAPGQCDKDWVSNTTWHRFVGTGGSKILEDKCPNSVNHCGVKYPGWVRGKHPEVSDGIKSMEIKFYYDYCASMHGTVNVRNCGDFYVYNFSYLPYWNCDYGICTEK